AWPLIEIVIEHLDPFRRKIAVELLAGAVGLGRAWLDVKNRALERRARPRPDDASLVVRSLDDGRNQAARANTVRTHVDRNFLAVLRGNHRLHLLRLLGAKIKNMTYLDAGRRALFVCRHFREPRRIMHFGGRSIL